MSIQTNFDMEMGMQPTLNIALHALVHLEKVIKSEPEIVAIQGALDDIQRLQGGRTDLRTALMTTRHNDNYHKVYPDLEAEDLGFNFAALFKRMIENGIIPVED